MALQEYLTSHGISHMTTPPHTPEHNGLLERKHRHIVETGLTLLTKSSMPKIYWPYAFATAVYLINRLPTPVISLSSPYHQLFGNPPNYDKLCVFDCLCFPWLRPYTSNKLEDRSKLCVFIGYSLTESAYHCLDMPTGRIYTSRHVRFVEDEFPFHTMVTTPAPPEISDTTVTNSHLPVIPIDVPHSVIGPPPPSNPPPHAILHQTCSQPTIINDNQQAPLTVIPSAPPTIPPANTSFPQVLPPNSTSSSSLHPSSEPTAPNENGPQPRQTNLQTRPKSLNQIHNI